MALGVIISPSASQHLGPAIGLQLGDGGRALMRLSITIPNGYRIKVRYHKDGTLEVTVKPPGFGREPSTPAGWTNRPAGPFC